MKQGNDIESSEETIARMIRSVLSEGGDDIWAEIGIAQKIHQKKRFEERALPKLNKWCEAQETGPHCLFNEQKEGNGSLEFRDPESQSSQIT